MSDILSPLMTLVKEDFPLANDGECKCLLLALTDFAMYLSILRDCAGPKKPDIPSLLRAVEAAAAACEKELSKG